MSEEFKIELPFDKIEPTQQSPEFLVIYSKPKSGKTTIAAELPDSLLLDFEKGSKFVNARKIQVKNIDHLRAILKEVKRQGSPYKYAILDTTTALEEFVIPVAESIYMNSPQGKNWIKYTADGKLSKDSGKAKYGNITNLANGAGYKYTREAFFKVIDNVAKVFPRVVLLAHVKDTVLEKNGVEVNTLDLDLTGKLKRVLASKSDAIGYMYRSKNQNVISFMTSDDITCGSRGAAHLSNKEIVISEMDEKGNIVTHWDKIFID
jgi:hypothetical protein